MNHRFKCKWESYKTFFFWGGGNKPRENLQDTGLGKELYITSLESSIPEKKKNDKLGLIKIKKEKCVFCKGPC